MANLEALAEEALKGGEDVQQELEEKIQEALACPCVEDIREGPCGKQFTEAFACYVRNFKGDKLGDCYPKFEAMHICMGDNPDSFSKYSDKASLPNAAQ